MHCTIWFSKSSGVGGPVEWNFEWMKTNDANSSIFFPRAMKLGRWAKIWVAVALVDWYCTRTLALHIVASIGAAMAMLMKATNHFSMKAAANRWFKGIVSLFYSMIYPWHFNAAHIFVVMTAGNYVEVLNGSISIFCPESSNAMPTLLHQAVYFQCLESLLKVFFKKVKKIWQSLFWFLKWLISRVLIGQFERRNLIFVYKFSV